ncbi:MAG: hypothetical protein QXT43_00875 [Candidatus Micrarchaeaceae archaeon]
MRKPESHIAMTAQKALPKVPLLLLPFLILGHSAAGFAGLDIISTLSSVQSLLAHIGPILSAIMFIIAGIFFAMAQLFPTYKRASLHATAADILVGAIIVAVLSVASNGLAIASTHLLSNITNSSI